jgi:hypothetical protein
VPLHMAFYCHYMVVVGVGKGIWRPLSVDTTSETIVKSRVVYCDVTKRNRVAMSHHRHNVVSRHYDKS